MSADELSKLNMLLEHWVEHNLEHSREFSEWAAKAKALGQDEVSDKMIMAARAMDLAGDLLAQAGEKLGEV